MSYATTTTRSRRRKPGACVKTSAPSKSSEGATLDEMLTVEPRRDLRWSHDDENYSILEKWCGDVIYREKDVDDLPLHRLRRTVIDAERWLWPQTFRDRADFDPYYVYDPRLGCLLVAPREH